MLKNLLDKARDLKNQLDSLRPLSAEVEGRVMQKLRIDWNFHSNNMEGNSLTYGETKALLLFGVTTQGKPLDDHRQIAGHEEAIDWLLDILAKKEDISEHFIRSLHQLILEKPYQVDAQTADGKPTKRWIKIGEYKTTPNHVKTKTGKLFYFATPEETPAKMNDLMDSYRKNTADEDINPILLAAAFHYEFVRIHPFDDGNGRMSRLLMNFILMRFGYPPAVIKTEEKELYYTALQLSDDKNSSLPLAEYLAQVVINSLELMLKGARGESIEEPDDLDKQLAMLEQELLQKGTKIEKIYSPETVEEWEKDILPILIDKFKAVNQKFVHFYASAEFKLSENKFADNHYISLSYSFNYFKIVIDANKKMNYNYYMYIELKHNQYVINNVLANYYHVLPTEEQLNTFANKISKPHVELITEYKTTNIWQYDTDDLPF